MPVLRRLTAGLDREGATAGKQLVENGRGTGTTMGLAAGMSRTKVEQSGWPGQRQAAGSSGLLTTCANSGCSSGWLHLLRSRSTPVFEGGWSCSPACTEARVGAALRREMGGRRSEVSAHRHRVPLGLVMLEQGWIRPEQLRKALDAQRAAGSGRLGTWLVEQMGVREQLVTRALSMQWGCPVLSLEYHDAQAMSPVVPRFFVDAFAGLPLRVAAGRILYLGFEDRLDPVLAFAVERMTGLTVEAGLVAGSRFRLAHERLLQVTFPRVEVVEAVSEPALVRVLSARIERMKPVEARLVRVHDCLWLRMWRKPQQGPVAGLAEVEDLVALLEAN